MDEVNQVDMSSEAIATRLRRVSQLRRLCLSLGRARTLDDDEIVSTSEDRNDNPENSADLKKKG